MKSRKFFVFAATLAAGMLLSSCGGPTSEDLVKQIASIMIDSDGYYIVDGVKTDIKATEVYTVKFETGFSTKIQDQTVLEGHKIDRPNIERTGYVFEGWYCNGEEWRFNSDVVLNDMTLTAKWTAKQYTVSFVNEKGVNPTDITVTFDSSYTLPSVEDVDGYVINGWFNGNQKYTGGIWKTDSDITLTAKWAAKEYTVQLNPGDGSVSTRSQKVTYGQSYSLPVPTNTYGMFSGWVCDGETVTDNQGNSLKPWQYLEDKTFTVEWIIEIYNASQLAIQMSTFPNAAFKMMNDIDLSGIVWAPIGTEGNPFKGTLDGNGNKISNLSLSLANNNSAIGLFGYVDGATIKNLFIENFGFDAQNIKMSYSIGSFFGSTCLSSNCSTLINCRASGSYVTASQSSGYDLFAGGLVGYANKVRFTDCLNEISIENGRYSGGFAGFASDATVFSSLNKGNISAKSIAGGLFGYVGLADISLCLNEGDITGVDDAGGFIGCSLGSISLNKVVNYGAITSSNKNSTSSNSIDDEIDCAAGGLVGVSKGYSTTAEIDKAYNTGSVAGYNAGGLIGMMRRGGLISNSYNSGSVCGYYCASGIAGWTLSSATIMQCLASGTLSNTETISLKNTLTQTAFGLNASDSYYTYENVNNTSKFIGKHGTYTTDIYGSNLYVNSMFWDEYDELTGQGDWVFHDDSLPTLPFVDGLEPNGNHG